MELPVEDNIPSNGEPQDPTAFPTLLLEGNQDACLGIDPASSIIGNIQGLEEYLKFIQTRRQL